MNPQELADQLMGEFKKQALQLLNETADEFDAMGMTDEQRQTYNDFTGKYGQKILQLKITLKEK